jgi:DNA polymerase-3 subunit delta'
MCGVAEPRRVSQQRRIVKVIVYPRSFREDGSAMSFKDFPEQEQGILLLQRSLERGRLAHGYLFAGHQLDELEGIARTLAKTLNCQRPVRGKSKDAPIDCCDACINCRKIENGNHADVHWVRPESKSRVIVIDQMRALMQEINLKPTEAEYKVAVVVGADRLNVQAANAFLKTLEEPPPKSVLILLTTEPERILETIQSRCLRLKFAGEALRRMDPAQMSWLEQFTDLAGTEQKSLLSRYRLLGVLLQKLTAMRTQVEETLTARSPLQRYDDAEKELRDKWEEELTAAIEAEYRRQRAEVISLVQWWLRDVWVLTLGVTVRAGQTKTAESEIVSFPTLAGTRHVAGRITPGQALENLERIEETQTLLHTNVQEGLAIEVGLLNLHL